MSLRIGILVIVAVIVVLSVSWLLKTGEQAADSRDVDTEGEAQAASEENDDRTMAQKSPVEDVAEPSDDNAERRYERQQEAMPEPDWLAVDDVDALVDELMTRFEDGDASAGRHLSTLASLCFQTYRDGADRMKQRAENEIDPDTRRQMEARYEKLRALEDGCADSRFDEPMSALEFSTDWTWHAADAGDLPAMYTAVFEQTGQPPQGWESEEQEDLALERRRDYARTLRAQCHADSLRSMGRHIARDSRVTAGLELGDFDDVSADTAQQMEGFAYRYMAARIEGQARPEQQARHADHALTAAEEAEAVTWAQERFSDCS